MGTPIPLVGIVEDQIIRYRSRRRAALHDRRTPGEIDDVETRELLAIADEAMRPTGTLCRTVRHVNACLGGAAGIESVAAQRSREADETRRLWDEDQEPPQAA